MTYAYPDYKSLKFDRPADQVLRITMARGKMNAMDFEFHHSLTTVWQHIEDDPSVSAVILTGEGRAFSAGGDFELEQKLVDEFEWRARMWKDGRDLVKNLIHFSKPLVSAINGAAAGGGLAVAMLSDISIAGRSAKIVDGHVRLGVAAGDHAAIIWPLLCGMAKAKYYLMSGEHLYAEEAERIGLISRVVDVNLSSLMACAQKFHDALAARRGSLITISSVGGLRATRGNPAYAASRAGAIHLTATLSQAWAHQGIRVDGVAPGLVDTKLTKVTINNDEHLRERLDGIPAGRLGTPDDMAGACLYLASPLAAYVFGQTITVDGGRTL